MCTENRQGSAFAKDPILMRRFYKSSIKLFAFGYKFTLFWSILFFDCTNFIK